MSTCILPMAAWQRAGGRPSAKVSCDDARGAKHHRNPGLDPHSLWREFYMHSWPSTVTSSKQQERAVGSPKTAQTADLPTAALQHAHVTSRTHKSRCHQAVKSALCQRQVGAQPDLKRLQPSSWEEVELHKSTVSLYLHQSGFSSAPASRLWFPLQTETAHRPQSTDTAAHVIQNGVGGSKVAPVRK